jgi:hypothetical protein
MRKAPTYGRIQTGTKNERTLMGQKDEGIRVTAETWNGRVEVKLEDDGNFTVLLGTKYGMAAPIARGNVGDLDRHFISGDGKVRYVDENGTTTEAEPIIMQFANPEVLR